MKTLKTIFVGILGAWMCMGGHAADNGCSKDSNDRISPAIALCSTHVYNIGATENQSDSAAKQYMNDVVALKTTLITQQMYKQYEYLDATIRRLKTQLEKAVLTASLEASGAATSSSSGSSAGTSKSRNIIVSGCEDCLLKLSQSAALDCLQSNLMYIRTAASSGNVGNAGRQLQRDVEAYNTWFKDKKHNDLSNLNLTKTDVEQAVNEFNVTISVAKTDLSNQNNRYNNYGQAVH